ncbi:hypothetical protein BB561_004568 [Smittium simulii]|uniref:Peroxisomal ATPase PEX1 n=1 Tax=Smittium simulii TaxID=133385 RepID=A0A2T9YFK7_9FUNG|nr:hypothetical protein BB561_004568 [Smittium simulii]
MSTEKIVFKTDFERKIFRHMNNLVLNSNDDPLLQFPSQTDFFDYIYETDYSMRRQKRVYVEKTIQRLIPIIKKALNLIAPTAELEQQKISQSFDSLISNENIKKSYSSSSIYQTAEKIKTMTKSEELKALNQSFDSEQNSINDLSKKRKRTKPTETEYSVPSIKLADMGGVETYIDDITELIVMPMRYPEVYSHLGVDPPRGVLLWGPPGCGKSMLAKAIAGESNVPLVNISAPEMVSGMSGESEKKIRDLFITAKKIAPCILFIDEIDAITQKRENASKDMERRMVSQLLTCIDGLADNANSGAGHVVLVGATNNPDTLDPALRRAGRFDREISMSVPDLNARIKILQVMTKKMRLYGDFDFNFLAKITPGYVGADLAALTTVAGMLAAKRVIGDISSYDLNTQLQPTTVENQNLLQNINNSDISSIVEDGDDKQMSTDNAQISTVSPITGAQNSTKFTPDMMADLYVTQDDFIVGLKKVQPSAIREGFATVPDVTWESIGALHSVRYDLKMAVVEPIANPELFEKVGISAPSGVLLWGPPGCGKTMLAKAVANECNTNFISVKGPELVNKYVGESERALRQLFNRARASSPCIIFFDEFDAIVPKRSDSNSEAMARIVNTLLAELDGVDGRTGVYVIAATNRPDIIDPAILRPGRLDKLIFVGLPTPEERYEILKTASRKTPLASNVDLQALSSFDKLSNFSGADIANLVREASVIALSRSINTKSDSVLVTELDFIEALKKISCSITDSDLKKYLELAKSI